MVKSRNSTVELLRILFMLGIVLCHVYVHGSNENIEWVYSLGDNHAGSYHLSIFSIGCIGVTGFMAISGYYGISMNKKKFCSLILTCLTWFLILNIISNRGISISIIHATHAWDAWWFMSIYLLITLVAPLVDLGFREFSKRYMTFFTLALFFYTYFGHELTNGHEHNFSHLLTVYVIARYIRFYPPPQFLLRNLSYFCAISMLLILFVPQFLCIVNAPSKFYGYFLSNNNFLFLICSLSLIQIAYRYNISIKPINWLSSSVIGVYLITDYIDVQKYLMPKLLPEVLNGIGFIYVILIYLACIMLDKMREKATEYVIRFFRK